MSNKDKLVDEEIAETAIEENNDERTNIDDVDETDEIDDEIAKLQKELKAEKKNIKEAGLKILNSLGEICICIALVSGAFAINSMNEKITDLEDTVEKQQEQIEELATFNRYSLTSHKEIKTTAEINEDSTAFRGSDYFNNNKLEDNLNRSKVFNMQDDTYYVLFYMVTCSHCNELESDMFDNINTVLKKTIYYYDADVMGDDSGFVWASDSSDKEVYTLKKNKFELEGTPTLVKVTPNSDKVKVFVGTDAIEEELGIN